MLDLINELYLKLMIYSPNINQNAYNRFYQEIFNWVAAIGNLPTSVLFDFEVFDINSFFEIFQKTSTNGWFYHLPDMEKTIEVSLQERYSNNPEFDSSSCICPTK